MARKLLGVLNDGKYVSLDDSPPEVKEARRRKFEAEIAAGMCARLQTDTSYFIGDDDGFGGNQRMRELYHRRAEAVGINTTGKRYVASLVKRGLSGGRDPAAWVPQTNGRSHIKNVIRKRRWSCDGRVEVKAPDYEIPNDPKPYAIAPDIIEKTVLMEVADNKLRVGRRERQRMKEETARVLVGNAND